MKKAIATGLAALVLAASTAVGCGNNDQTLPNNVNNIPSLTATPHPKSDLHLHLNSIPDQTLIFNDSLHYLFVMRDSRYHLLRVEPDQKTEPATYIPDPNYDQTLTLNLGDGILYNLSFNREAGDYQLSPR